MLGALKFLLRQEEVSEPRVSTCFSEKDRDQGSGHGFVLAPVQSNAEASPACQSLLLSPATAKVAKAHRPLHVFLSGTNILLDASPRRPWNTPQTQEGLSLFGIQGAWGKTALFGHHPQGLRIIKFLLFFCKICLSSLGEQLKAQTR